MSNRIISLLTSLVLATSLAGCASIERAADISPAQPIETLMVTTFVDIATRDAVTLGSGPRAVAQAMMEAYHDQQSLNDGGRMNAGFTQPIADFLASEGFNLVFDSQRAKRADQLIGGFVAKQGQPWTHPEGASKHFNNRAFAGDLYKDIGSTLGKGGREAFASIYVLVVKQDAFMGEIPVVSIDIEIVDQTGREVFSATGRGEGEKAGRLDMSPQNLRLAMDQAFQAMRDAR